MTKDLDLLGKRVKDKVTGFTGIVSTVGYDLYGCIQAIVTPGSEAANKMEDSRWFDTKRLSILDEKPVMEQPTFEIASKATKLSVPGGQDKPRQVSLPVR